MYNGIQTSKVTLDTICMQNAQVYHYATRTKNVGKEFTSEYLDRPEKFFNKDPWLYKINKYGFRGDNWNFKPSIAVFGCSNIFGIGVQKSVTDIMSELLGQPVHNLGVPGGSSANIIKTFASFANLHPMTDAIISLPSIQRVFRPELQFNSNEWNWQNKIPYGSDTDYKLMKAIDRVWKNDVTISHIADLIDWAELIAKSKGINIYWTSWSPDNPSSSNKNVEFHIRDLTSKFFMWPDMRTSTGWKHARDGEHPGPQVIKNLATNIITAIENK
jgi:hypothetical protein